MTPSDNHITHKMSIKSFDTAQLSNHLFWDIDKQTLHAMNHKKYIIDRVLHYGKWSDWCYIKEFYGLELIGEVVTQLKSIEPKTLHFIALMTNQKIENFRCYTTKPLNQKHWSY